MRGSRKGTLVVVAVFLTSGLAGADQGVSWIEGRPTHESRYSVLVPEITGFPPPVRNACAAAIALGTANWAWTERARNADGETVSRWDPSKPGFGKVVLLEKDGRPPTAEELEAFRRRQYAELEEDQKETPTVSERIVRVVRAMRFVETGRFGTRVRYRLRFEEPDDSGLGWIDRAFVRVLTRLRGVVEVDEQRPGFVSVHLSLPEEVGVFPAVKIRSLIIRLQSEWLDAAHTWMPVRLSVEVDGGIWLFGSIARTVELEFFDYENVGLAPRDPQSVLEGVAEATK